MIWFRGRILIQFKKFKSEFFFSKFQENCYQILDWNQMFKWNRNDFVPREIWFFFRRNRSDFILGYFANSKKKHWLRLKINSWSSSMIEVRNSSLSHCVHNIISIHLEMNLLVFIYWRWRQNFRLNKIVIKLIIGAKKCEHAHTVCCMICRFFSLFLSFSCYFVAIAATVNAAAADDVVVYSVKSRDRSVKLHIQIPIT